MQDADSVPGSLVSLLLWTPGCLRFGALAWQVGPHILRGPVHSESNWGFVVHAQRACISCLSISAEGGLRLLPHSSLSVLYPSFSPRVVPIAGPLPAEELAQLSGDLGFRFPPL